MLKQIKINSKIKVVIYFTLTTNLADILDASNEDTIFKSLSGFVIFLAVFYLSALRNISGWKRSARFYEFANNPSPLSISTHFFN